MSEFASEDIGLHTISEIIDEYCQEIVKTRCQQAAVKVVLERFVVRLQAEWNRATNAD
jgi:hypothetical protein